MRLIDVYTWAHAHSAELFGAGAALAGIWKAIPAETRQRLELAHPRLAGAARALVAILPDLLGLLRILFYGVMRGQPRPELQGPSVIGAAGAPPQPAPPGSSAGFASAPVLRFLVAVAVAGALPLALARCAAGAPHVTAVTPRLVQRPEYGTCLEVGGKVEVRGHGVLTQLSSTCWESAMDAGAGGGDAGAEASASEPEAVEGKGDGGGL